MKRYYWGAAFVLLFIGGHTAPAEAADIHYGHIEDMHGRTLYIQYHSPAGNENFLCGVLSTDCTSYGTTTPSLLPPINGKTTYPNSHDGHYGITETASGTAVTYKLYDTSGDVAKQVAVLPFTKETKAYKFPWDDEHLMLFATDGTVSTYNIKTGTLSSFTPDQMDFPMRSFSPHAGYLAAYNYDDKALEIWNTKTGHKLSIPSATPAFVEFSQDERYAAFTDTRDGYLTLYIVDLKRGTEDVRRVFRDNFTVEDYVWYQDKLYAVGNMTHDSYRWVLYRFDPSNRSTRIVAHDVSYGDYIRPIGNYGLSFLQIDGKNTNVALYNPSSNMVRVIRPLPASPASTQLTRSEVNFGDGLQGVLYTPKKPSTQSTLFVWLHGGPMRETSLGYHSYLSYGVYDELLERLADSGAYVLKVDYPGSFGHGSQFEAQLKEQLGKVDVAAVEKAAHAIQKQYHIKKSYLIGNSYGGYLGPRVLVDDQRHFDGAIAINGVYDWYDLLTRIPSSPFKVYFDGLPDLSATSTNMSLYEQASIVKNLPELNADKKLLLVYGTADTEVPTWQTKDFFYQADALGKDVRLLTLDGEEHIIRARSSLDELCSFIGENLSIDNLQCHE